MKLLACDAWPTIRWVKGSGAFPLVPLAVAASKASLGSLEAVSGLCPLRPSRDVPYYYSLAFEGAMAGRRIA